MKYIYNVALGERNGERKQTQAPLFRQKLRILSLSCLMGFVLSSFSFIASFFSVFKVKFLFPISSTMRCIKLFVPHQLLRPIRFHFLLLNNLVLCGYSTLFACSSTFRPSSQEEKGGLDELMLTTLKLQEVCWKDKKLFREK